MEMAEAMSRFDPIPDPLDGPPLRWWELSLVPLLAVAGMVVFAAGVVRLLARETFRRR